MSLILELGSVYARVGLSGDTYPRATIHYSQSASQDNISTSITSPISVPLYKINLHSPALATPLLKAFLKKMYYNVSSRQLHVILIQSPLFPAYLLELVEKILFDVHQIPSFTILPSSYCAMMLTGTMTGIVIDLGYSQSTIVKVNNGTVDHQVQSCQFGGSFIINAIKLLMCQSGDCYRNKIKVKLDMDALNVIHLSIWEEFILKHIDYTDSSNEHDDTIHFNLDQDTIVSVKNTSIEKIGMNFVNSDEEDSIASLLLVSINQSNADTLCQVIKNVLLIGGLANIPGLKSQLIQKIQMSSKHKLVWRSSVFPEHVQAWVGGSLASTMRRTE